jgi:hypothetical protein
MPTQDQHLVKQAYELYVDLEWQNVSCSTQLPESLCYMIKVEMFLWRVAQNSLALCTTWFNLDDTGCLSVIS